MRLANIVCVALAIASAGCAHRPYAEVTGERTAKSDPREEDVLILAVDGLYRYGGALWENVDPGLRSLVLTTRRGGSNDYGHTSSLVELDAKACMRYQFVALHRSAFDTRGWEVVLRKVEPIPGCVAEAPPKPKSDG